MHIFVNGAARDMRATTCAQALEELGYAHGIVATALNGTFLPGSSRESTILTDGDALEILAPMQGG